ncbi:TIGR00730 family Rossman fold protein [Aquirufa nivalisilvae]|uniref:Cytokinin riboside 5'-monophosphate phosphoribohydrolase n=1 Tax=Aquirufa ecclesiirivi TaxID=2715124 RepID=A0ABT4JH58_9BACT|nr:MULTISPECIES: TIGR00730 family Rossman fold protein [Aquirufa]MCZ2473092.1 TIGR00730 family Rossman fold protein [Aquirufa ecclesiirivi]MCZ2474881.1 TIGR00730 family Rossman fold protein [Aquirufa ecclesiirivi]MCZ2479521.1 TIGR00730 family Rossman fold protein [Aquirufa nivalisilvae]MCZ2481511.1 TIGR00730 family Rossman fold protein [Aquirufa nivalisilvae]MDF0692739.1 TIGR00730 family Rossman fold protein [Aquirufa ecclesiirivi]
MSKKILIYCGSSKGNNPVYEEEVKRLAQELKKHDCSIIFGAGSVGLMGVMADEYLRLGGEVIGVIPSFMEPWEVKHLGIQTCHVTESMHERKQLMAELADGVIAMPGGFGTFDELFEMLTWKQLDLHQMPIAIFNTAGYYDLLLQQLQHMIQEGFLKERNLTALHVESDAAKLADWMMDYVPEKMEKKWIYRA